MNGSEELQIVDTYDKVEQVIANVAAVARRGRPARRDRRRLPRPRAQADGEGAREGLDPYKLMFIEEPVLSENAEALRDIVNQTNTPIALGERLYSRWDFKHILAGGYVDIIQPDASHAGGITECRKIATLAESYDVALALHCPLGPLRSPRACSSTRSATTHSSRSRASASTTTRATTCSTTCATRGVPLRGRLRRDPAARARHRRERGEGARDGEDGAPLAQPGVASRGRQRRRVVSAMRGVRLRPARQVSIRERLPTGSRFACSAVPGTCRVRDGGLAPRRARPAVSRSPRTPAR